MERTPEKYCRDCKYWQCDQVGDKDTGMGKCLIRMRPGVIKWPRQDACEKFEDKNNEHKRT
jgi:hypothetical protein